MMEGIKVKRRQEKLLYQSARMKVADREGRSTVGEPRGGKIGSRNRAVSTGVEVWEGN